MGGNGKGCEAKNGRHSDFHRFLLPKILARMGPNAVDEMGFLHGEGHLARTSRRDEMHYIEDGRNYQQVLQYYEYCNNQILLRRGSEKTGILRFRQNLVSVVKREAPLSPRPALPRPALAGSSYIIASLCVWPFFQPFQEAQNAQRR
jgi:hypothetical protein